jgi:hypothetical protein
MANCLKVPTLYIQAGAGGTISNWYFGLMCWNGAARRTLVTAVRADPINVK